MSLSDGTHISEWRPVWKEGKLRFEETIRPVTDFPEERAPKVKLRRSGMSRTEAKRLGILR